MTMSKRKNKASAVAQWLKVQAEVDAGYDALLRGDNITGLKHHLTACIEAAGTDQRQRFILFQQVDNMISSPSSLRESVKEHNEEWERLKKNVAENDHVSVLYRAYASYLYASIHLRLPGGGTTTDPSLLQYLQRVVDFCDSVPSADRLVPVLKIVKKCNHSNDGVDGDSVPTGVLLDELRTRAVNEMEYQKCPWDYFQKNFAQCSSHADRMNDIGKALSKKLQLDGPLEERFSTTAMWLPPPVVTSAVIGKIEALPTKENTTVLIVPNAFPPTPNADHPLLPQGFAPPPEIFDRFPVRAFTVDLGRFDAGETTLVFDQIQALFCDPKETRQKSLISAFAATCLYPYVHMRGQTPKHQAVRPTRVLLTPTDFKDAHVLSFLNLMGVTDIQKADVAMLNLLNNTFFEEINVRSSRHLTPFNKVPALNDLLLGVRCMNCGKIGATVKACPCGKAWFCNEECQKVQWPNHKKEHKAILKARKDLEANPTVLHYNHDVDFKPFLRLVSSNVNCSLQAPVLLHWYLSLLKQTKKRDPFAPRRELRLIDGTKYFKETCTGEELFRFVFEKKGRSSFAAAKDLIHGPAIMCPITPIEIRDNLEKYGPGLVSAFHVYPDFHDTTKESHNGLPPDGSESCGQHSMVLIGVRQHKENEHNCFLMLQNFWESKTFVEVDLIYFQACKARLIFFEGAPKEPSVSWSMPAGDTKILQTDAELECDDYFDEEPGEIFVEQSNK